MGDKHRETALTGESTAHVGRLGPGADSGTVSVAMCTYNGEKYLGAQLESILAQTRLPDELVVCDDNSTDATVSMLEQFAASAPFPVRLYRNARRMGSTRNFEQAIRHCRGEFIALTDQDDVWHPEKLERLLGAFEPGVGLVFSDARVVDKNLNCLGYRLWETAFFGRREQRRVERGEAFELLLRGNVVTGATMAFRAVHRDWVLPISPNWVHDGWIAILIAAVSKLRFVRDPLIDYRQHAGNQIGARKVMYAFHYRDIFKTRTDLIENLANLYEDVYAHIIAHPSGAVPDPLREQLMKKVNHGRIRIEVRQGEGRLLELVGELLSGRYNTYARGWLSFLKDVAILLARKRRFGVRQERRRPRGKT